MATGQQAYIKADSVSGVKGGAQLELGVSATVLGDATSLSLDLTWPPSADGILDSVWDHIKSDLGLTSTSSSSSR